MAAAGKFQSTHPRGVRHRDRAGVGGGQWSFNPRTRVGCDQIMDDWVTYQDAFQSTHPRGVRRFPVKPDTVFDQGFNPRTRVGCDGTPVFFLLAARTVSIHAPAWGATWLEHEPSAKSYVSIHAPAWGATAAFQVNVFPCQGFNPRTRVGCDGSPLVVVPSHRQFQSTHPRGVRRR